MTWLRWASVALAAAMLTAVPTAGSHAQSVGADDLPGLPTPLARHPDLSENSNRVPTTKWTRRFALPQTSLGAPNGAAALDNAGKLLAGQAPTGAAPSDVAAVAAKVGQAYNLVSSGTTQGDALLLPAAINHVSGGTGGVILNIAFNKQQVFNSTAATLQVYPSPSSQIMAFGTNVPATIAPGGSATFLLVNVNQWSAF